MKVVPYQTEFHDKIYEIWKVSGINQGYAPLSAEDFDAVLLCHRGFCADYAFVMLEEKEICGFICGCIAENIPEASDAGFFTCILLLPKYDTLKNTKALLNALENSFRRAGKRKIICSYFNPIRLPWVIPETKGCQHNNAPGIGIDLPLYERMLNCGYHDRVRECAMYLNLSGFEIPDAIGEKEKKALEEGYSIEWYDSKKHTELREMVDSMNNSMWSSEIPYAAEHINMLVAVKENSVVGFTGPVYPEKTGRGYFAGIAVSAKHEKHGLGTLLFYRLCLEEKRAGSAYMSLFTGMDNHAQRIYKGAGFQVKRIFSVMEKEIAE
ncbi:MAG: GNAT family N-acetyltransferase [Acetatifactor sp.]